MPDLIANYNKDITIELEGVSKHLDTNYFFTREGGLFRAEEYFLVDGPYHYYLDLYAVGCTTPDFFIEYGCDLDDKGCLHHDIVEELLSLGMVDDEQTQKVGRVAYKNFKFEDQGGSFCAIQIKSAVIDPDYRGAGLARNIYKTLVLKHEHIVCDNTQSISGGSLWASSIHSIGEVRIYDTNTQKFVDVLGFNGVGVSGIVPWSCQHLNIDQITDWGRAFSHDPCHHIVNILSKKNLY